MNLKLLLPITLFLSATLSFGDNTSVPDPELEVSFKKELSWQTVSGNTYQLQSSDSEDGPWIDVGEIQDGDGGVDSYTMEPITNFPVFRVVETVPSIEPVAALPINGSFEEGEGNQPDNWNTEKGSPPARSSDDARTGEYSMLCSLANVGSTPSEGGMSQEVGASGGSITGGQFYDFSFWAKQVEIGPSYIQQFQVQWLNAGNTVIGGTGLQNFSGQIGSWIEIRVPDLEAPANATNAVITFRFVTGAVSGGSGQVFIDDVSLDSGLETQSEEPGETLILTPTIALKPFLGWFTVSGVDYLPQSSTDLLDWATVSSSIEGDGERKEISLSDFDTIPFYRLEMQVEPILAPSNLRVTTSAGDQSVSLAWNSSMSSGVSGYRVLYGLSPDEMTSSIDLGDVNSVVIPGLLEGELYFFAVQTITETGSSLAYEATITAMPNTAQDIVALFSASTELEPDTSFETSDALYTYLADRVRDRHARESQFKQYDHYLSWYWEQRVCDIEIIDYVAKGGNKIVFNYTNQEKLNPAEFRTFFRGISTVAEYNSNQIATLVSTNPSTIPGETDYNYSATIDYNPNAGRSIQIGDRIEIEISQFLLAPRNGRSNYYGTTLLYVVGEGIVPWAQGNDMGFDGGIVGTVNQSLDSYPLPKEAWLGGLTTLPYQYSDEPQHRFKQLAGNISPTNGHAFMLGRRLHHTDFGNGMHSEPDNPVFTQQVGKLGHAFINRSCVQCHTNNGRSIPEPIGQSILKSVVKVAADSSGTPHPVLGEVLQPQSTSGAGEGTAVINSYTTIQGQYGDGTPYTLRKPNYTFTGTAPEYYSVRAAQSLVGLGLLEAISEETILSLADPEDSDEDGISGRVRTVIDPETGQARLGRFTHKGGMAKVSHQIAAALKNDMGITTSVEPILDGETSASSVELSDDELDQMTRYVALLGVAARRDLFDEEAIAGEAIFDTIGCIKCHVSPLQTSEFHPMAELRGQTIHPFTDLLLHDMGAGLASNLGEGNASGSEWRTAPLWNIGLTEGVSKGEAYLHDGRARTLEEAILWHGGEGEDSKEEFRNLSAVDRDALIKYLKSL